MIAKEIYRDLKPYLPYAFLAVGAYFGWQFIRKRVNEIKTNNAMNEVGTNSDEGRATELATRIYSAQTNSYMPFGWGTNEEGLMAAAKEVGEACLSSQVIKAYRRLYPKDWDDSGELMTDVMDELGGDTEEFAQFQKLFACQNTGQKTQKRQIKAKTIYPSAKIDATNFTIAETIKPNVIVGTVDENDRIMITDAKGGKIPIVAIYDDAGKKFYMNENFLTWA